MAISIAAKPLPIERSLFTRHRQDRVMLSSYRSYFCDIKTGANYPAAVADLASRGHTSAMWHKHLTTRVQQRDAVSSYHLDEASPFMRLYAPMGKEMRPNIDQTSTKKSPPTLRLVRRTLHMHRHQHQYSRIPLRAGRHETPLNKLHVPFMQQILRSKCC